MSMVTPELLRFLFQYNAWADRRLLDVCGQLSNEQFTRELGSSFSSVRDTVVHLYGAEWIWNERFHGNSPTSLLSTAGYPDLASIRALGGICHVERHDGLVRLFVRRAADLLGPLQRIMTRDKSVRLRIAPISLENLFLHLTGQEARE